MEQVHKKIDIMRFTDIDVNFDVTYKRSSKLVKILSMDILRVLSHYSVACSGPLSVLHSPLQKLVHDIAY